MGAGWKTELWETEEGESASLDGEDSDWDVGKRLAGEVVCVCVSG